MLSIVYITCNRSSELIKSIESCEAHVSIAHEYVIIDNGSTDDTEQHILIKVKEGYPIRYMIQEKNHGVSGGRNIGFKEAKGDVCYFIDDDATIISEGFVLDIAYKYMKENPKIMAMGTDCFDTERKTQLVGLHQKGASANEFAPIRSFVGCSHFIRKENFTYDYLYPDNLMYGSEELYEGLSVYRVGGIVMQFPQLKILHEPSMKTREGRKERQRHGHINTFVIKKYFLPKGYKVVSNVLFLLRIARFEKMSLKRIAADYREVKARYDSRYSRKMTCSQIRYMIRKFGWKAIV